MAVYRLLVAYDGGGFHGFARQRGLRTVQGALEDALELILRELVVTVGAGRTDAGVHAAGQVVSFSFDGEVPGNLARRLTRLCGPEVAVVAAERASDGFDARLSARWRQYRYRILNREAPDPLRRHVTWHVAAALDVAAMRENSEAAVGAHDFSAFCRVPPGGHARRRVLSVEVTAEDDEVHTVVRATAFCHQMVRSLVGTMATGRSVAHALSAHRGQEAGPVAPAHGLCLEAVGY